MEPVLCMCAAPRLPAAYVGSVLQNMRAYCFGDAQRRTDVETALSRLRAAIEEAFKRHDEAVAKRLDRWPTLIEQSNWREIIDMLDAEEVDNVHLLKVYFDQIEDIRKSATDRDTVDHFRNEFVAIADEYLKKMQQVRLRLLARRGNDPRLDVTQSFTDSDELRRYLESA